MQVKKMYQEIVELLQNNADKKVRTIMPEIMKLTVAQRNPMGNSVVRDNQGNVVGLQCYYFYRWMPLVGDEAVEFGVKTHTSSGYNPMSKLGAKLWTRQQTAAYKGRAELLDAVEAGEITPEEIAAQKEQLEIARTERKSTDLGYETREQLVEYLNNYGIVTE